jgi:hypothetical protein
MSHEHKPSSAVSQESIAAGHEVTDATPRNIVLFLVWLSVSLVVVVAITLSLFYTFNQTEEDAAVQQFPGSPLDVDRPQSPAPPLQPSPGHETLPYQDWQSYLADYTRLAGTYGQDTMADRQVHDRMPVEAAMKILAQDGLPPGPAVLDVPTPQGPGNSMATPYSEGGRGSKTGTAAAPGVSGQ